MTLPPNHTPTRSTLSRTLHLSSWAGLLLLLTALTQFGGLLLLGCWPLLRRIRPRSWPIRLGARVAAFGVAYLAALWLVSHHLAPAFGRVSLPCGEADEGGRVLAPAHPAYCLLARNFVTPRTRAILIEIATTLAAAEPGSRLLYLDASLPFLDRFPLIPHLSHHDGRKVDLALAYRDRSTGSPVAGAASPIGYWAYEAPRPGEPRPCGEGSSLLRWDFDRLQPFFAGLEMEPKRTRALLAALLAHPDVEKVLLEPHLQGRMGLNDPKLRFQGCRAARHDDHIHVQVR